MDQERAPGKLSNVPNLSHLPPTSEAFLQNVLRAHYQCAVWKSCLLADPDPTKVCNIINCYNNTLLIFFCSLGFAQYSRILACSCKVAEPCKRGNCSCKSLKISCTQFCACQNSSESDSKEIILKIVLLKNFFYFKIVKFWTIMLF